MSHSVDLKRRCRNGECIFLELKLRMNDLYVYYDVVSTENKTESSELKQLVNLNQEICAIAPNLQGAMSEKLTELQENGNDDEEEIEVLTFTSQRVFQLTHISCRFESGQNSMPVTRAKTEEYGLPQYDLKYRLKTLDEKSNANKIFTKNSCPVCLKSYKDVLDEGHHLVVTDCCHVFCCDCLDNILKSTDQRCPICREDLYPIAFEMMNFNIDLKLNKELSGEVYCETFDE